MQNFGYGTLTHPYNKSSRLRAALVSIMLRNYTIAETARLFQSVRLEPWSSRLT